MPSQPPLKLSILIIGGGIAGFSSAIGLKKKGHSVKVLERHSSCQSLGAPIHVAPNATRVLISYGMEDILSPMNNNSEKTMFRRYENGDVLMKTAYNDLGVTFGSPSWYMARFNLQDQLGKYAISIGIDVVWNARIEAINLDEPSVQLEDGTSLKADLIIGADGIASKVRQEMLGPVKSLSPITIYNIDIPIPLVKANPKTAHLLSEQAIWMGPHGLIVQMLMPDHKNVVNLALADDLADNGKEGDWLTLADLGKVRERYSGWAEPMREMLEMAAQEDCYLWKLSELESLSTWSSEGGKAVIIGDAAHAMIAYAGQGASQAIEDSACLSECLDCINSLKDIPYALKAFEKIRKPRVEWITTRASKVNLPTYHLPDGPAQQKRDEIFKSMKSGMASNQSWTLNMFDEPPCPSSQPSHPLVWPYVYGYDVFDHTHRYLEEHGLKS